MDDLNLLANALMALDDKLAVCMKCGMCQAVCPVYGETMMEADVTRGKISLLENLAHLVIEDPEAVNDKLNRCLLCGSCQANCPSGVSILEIFMDARAVVATYLGLSPVKKTLFRTLLPNPRLFGFLLRISGPFQKFFLHDDESAQKTLHAPLLTAVLGDRHMPALAPVSLRDKLGALNTPAGKSRHKVAFFPGCLGDRIYTSMSEACLKVFDYHEVGVYMPTNFACCGIPALASGDREGFEKMVMQNVDAFKQGTFDTIVTPCASCTETIRSLWPQMSGKMPYKYRDAINELSQKAMDINVFLVDVLKVKPRIRDKRGVRTSVTYHESCHLLKSLGVSAQPRALIRMNPDYELVEMKEADRCCGCGGSFTLTHYDLAQKIGQRKRDNIVASGASVVATACPACMMQLSDTLAHNKDPQTVRHTIEIYADSLE
ncbi:MAG: (Fe-S)-binding protein [Bilophila sp.]